MLDALKGLVGGGRHQKRLEEFRALIDSSREERRTLREGLAALAVTKELINSAREERRALSGALRQATDGTARMVETSKTLESAEARAKSSTVSLEPLAKRIEELEHRATALGEGDQRVEALAETTAQAQRQAAKLISLEGELESYSREVQQLRSQTRDTGASLEAFRRELAPLEDVRNQFQQARGELKELEQGGNQAIALRLELEQMHVVAGQLAQDYNKIHDTAREVRKDSAAASRAVREVKRKLDVQVASLDVGLKQVARGEKTLTRIDRIVEKTEARLGAAEGLRDECVRETARMEKDGHELVDFMRTFIERLAVEKQGVAAFDERLRALHGSVQGAERRMAALSAHGRQLESLPPRVDELSGAFQALTTRADELGEKQTGLETAQEQLARVQDMASQATAQYESLRQSQAELDQHVARVTETTKFVEVFEGRLDALKRDVKSLDVGLKQVARGEKTLTRIDRIVEKTEARLGRGRTAARRVRARDGTHGEGRPRARRPHAHVYRAPDCRETGGRGIRRAPARAARLRPGRRAADGRAERPRTAVGVPAAAGGRIERRFPGPDDAGGRTRGKADRSGNRAGAARAGAGHGVAGDRAIREPPAKPGRARSARRARHRD